MAVKADVENGQAQWWTGQDRVLPIEISPNGPFKFHNSVCVLWLAQYDYERTEAGDRVILGKGTYGVVYAGRDLSNQVRIAIKEIPERDSR